MGLLDSIKKIFDRKCTFCGSRKNIKSCTVLAFLYYYCNKKECLNKIDKIKKRKLFIKNMGNKV